jgi:hypothetical protein
MSYWVNFDVSNWTGGEVNDFHLTVDGHIDPDEYYTEEDNPFGPPKRTPGSWGTGTTRNDFTTFRWEGATIQNGQRVHLGYHVDGADALKKAEPAGPLFKGTGPAYWTRNGKPIATTPSGATDPDKAPPRIPFPGIRIEFARSTADVFIMNDTGIPLVEFWNLASAVVPAPVSLRQLVWDNPTLQWTPAGYPQAIVLNEELDVCSIDVSAGGFLIVRMICTDPDEGNYVRTLFEVPIP